MQEFFGWLLDTKEKAGWKVECYRRAWRKTCSLRPGLRSIRPAIELDGVIAKRRTEETSAS